MNELKGCFYKKQAKQLWDDREREKCELFSTFISQPKIVSDFKKRIEKEYGKDDGFMKLLHGGTVLTTVEMKRKPTLRLWEELEPHCRDWCYVQPAFQAGRLNPDITIRMAETYTYWTSIIGYAPSEVDWILLTLSYANANIKGYEEKVSAFKSRAALMKHRGFTEFAPNKKGTPAPEWYFNDWKPGHWEFPLTEAEHVLARGYQVWLGLTMEVHTCARGYALNNDVKFIKDCPQDRIAKADYKVVLNEYSQQIQVTTSHGRFNTSVKKDYDNNRDLYILYRSSPLFKDDKKGVKCVSDAQITEMLNSVRDLASV